MLNVESKLWKLKCMADGTCYVTQKASATTRYSHRSEFPHSDAIAAMTERQFDKMCREAFHGA